MNKIVFYFIFFWVVSISAQSSWKKMSSKNAINNKNLISRKSIPKNFSLYNLDTDYLKENITSKKTISIPNSSGENIEFNVEESSNFSRKVAKQYGQINSYTITAVAVSYTHLTLPTTSRV